MSNNDLDNKILEWSKRFVAKLQDYELKEIIKKENLSKFNSEILKKFPEYGTWDFTTDFVLLLKKKENSDIKTSKEYELILINREKKSIGLRSIGELMCYNRICNPMYSFLISDKGHSSEISYFMIDSTYREKLLNFNASSLIIFSFDEIGSRVKENSIIPSSYRKLLSE